MVQRAFTILADYPGNRLEFSIADQKNTGAGFRWVKVMDEAWPGLRSNPRRR